MKNTGKITLIIFVTMILVCVVSSSAVFADNSTVAVTDNSTSVSVDTTTNNSSVINENITVNSTDITNNSATDSNINNNLTTSDNSSNSVSSSSDVYFDASVSSDGSGTISSPYKTVTADRLVAGSTAHFASGTYTINFEKTVDGNINIVGAGMDKTFLNLNYLIYSNNHASFYVNSGYTLNLKDLTMVGVDTYGFGKTSAILNYGKLILTNTKFMNFVATSTNSREFGGAIFSAGTITATNSYFVNNLASYGGAIYVDGGKATFTSCNFINNTANNFGGAIGSISSNLTFINTNFNNNRALNDAGGAIYARSTNLVLNTSTLMNSNGTFGGSVCILDGTISVTGSTFLNNTAVYEGGAIFDMYALINITGSNFYTNTALNGGAIYGDNCTQTQIKSSKFLSNKASGYGGAIFSTSNPTFVSSGNTFTSNSATNTNDIYNQTSYAMYFGNSNYTTIVSTNKNYTGTIPTKYNLADYGYVSSIKDQGAGGSCWSFSALASLESCILKANGGSYDFSEENMKNLMAFYSIYGKTFYPNDGGNPYMAIGYLTSWLGPISETTDSYNPYSALSQVFDSSLLHVQDVYYIPARTSYTDNNAIKLAILDYGAVFTSLYMNTATNYYNIKTYAYYCENALSTNHGVTIVGWDDSYSASNFNTKPAGNGAWIVKNSWGSAWGNGGYFYVSYYDKTLVSVGSQSAYTFILTNPTTYNKNYQYDMSGMTNWLSVGSQGWYKNVFTSTGNDLLAAVSTYFSSTTSYTITVYVNNVVKLTQSGSSSMGYYTIKLNNQIPLTTGDNFTVEFEISSDSANIPIAYNGYLSRSIYGTSTSFISFDGSYWLDLTTLEFWTGNPGQIACIKAFTVASDKVRTTTILNTTTSLTTVVDSVLRNVTLQATIKDSTGALVNDGYVIFSLNGLNVTSKVSNGLATYTTSLASSGIYTASATYVANSYYYASTDSTDVTMNPASTITSLVSSGNGLTRTFTATVRDTNSNIVSEGYVTFEVNGLSYVVYTNGGVATYTTTFTAGTYTVKVTYKDGANNVNSRYASSTTYITLDVTQPVIKDSPTLSYTFDMHSNGYTYFVATLKNSASEGIYGQTIYFTIGGVTYTATTNANGVATIIQRLGTGSFSISASYKGNDNYNSYVASSVAVVKGVSTILKANNLSMNYEDGSSFKATLTDIDGNILSGVSVHFLINGVSYFCTTNSLGVASLPIHLYAGTYSISSYFSRSGYNVSSSTGFVIVTKAGLSKKSVMIYTGDLTLNYLDGTSFVATLKDSYGNPIAGKTVYILINTKPYPLITNSNGQVSLPIRLYPGVYVLGGRFAGDDDYYMSSSSGWVSVLNASSNLIATGVEDLTRNINQGEYFKVSLVDQYKNAIAGETVRVQINNKFYYLTTDAEGVASIKIGLSPKTYTFYSLFLGSSTYLRSNHRTTSLTVHAVTNVLKSSNSLSVLTSNLDTSISNISSTLFNVDTKNKEVSSLSDAVVSNVKTSTMGDNATKKILKSVSFNGGSGSGLAKTLLSLAGLLCITLKRKEEDD